MEKICIVGNCQMSSLLVYLSETIDINKYSLKWIAFSKFYGEQTKAHSNRIASRIEGRGKIIIDENEGRDALEECNILIYQHISDKRSTYFNSQILSKIKCKKISFPRILFDKRKIKLTYEGMKVREEKNSVDIKLSDYILENHEKIDLLLSQNHPTTTLFIYMLKQIMHNMEISFDEERMEKFSLEDRNYAKLPIKHLENTTEYYHFFPHTYN